MQNTTFLGGFFANPIVKVSQALSRYELDDDLATDYWPGDVSVLLFTVESERRERTIAIAGRDYELVWKELEGSYAHLPQVEHFASKDLGTDQKYVGTATLDIAMCPVTGWSELRVTELVVIEKDNSLLGFSLGVNLGTKVGVFVTPNPGVTLTFNDQCEVVLSQARNLQKTGKVNVFDQKYEGRATPKTLSAIDWFDWIR